MIDSSSIRVHQHAALVKKGPRLSRGRHGGRASHPMHGRSRGGLTTKIHTPADRARMEMPGEFAASKDYNSNNINGLVSGGGSGIRTRDTVSRIHTFQACAFNHSATPPSCGNSPADPLLPGRPENSGTWSSNAPAGRLANERCAITKRACHARPSRCFAGSQAAMRTDDCRAGPMILFMLHPENSAFWAKGSPCSASSFGSRVFSPWPAR